MHLENRRHALARNAEGVQTVFSHLQGPLTIRGFYRNHPFRL